MKKVLLSFFLFLFTFQITALSEGEIGKPIITTYNCIDIGINYQVWDFVEDNRGIMYLGSSPGVFEFDGSTWRSIPVANNTFARSLAIDKNNRIYVGASNDIGYLAPNEKGELHFVSLLNFLKEEDRNFTYTWTTIVTEEGIYFQSLEGIFRFTPLQTGGWKIKVWKPQVRFSFAFWLNNTYYVQQGGVGLMKMINDSLTLLPGGNQFANERLQVMFPFKKEGKDLILVGTFNTGLYLFDGNSFEPFTSEADSFARINTLYRGMLLPNGDLCFSTLDGGTIISSKEGKIKLLLDRRRGLSSNSVTGMFIDKNGLLWLAPEGSVSIVEYPSSLTQFDESMGQISSVSNIIRFQDRLYLAETNGVFYLDNNTSTIHELSGFLPGNNQSFHFAVVKDKLLVAHGTGLYSIDENNKVSLIQEAGGIGFVPNFIHQSLKDPNRLYVGLVNGLASFYFNHTIGRWILEGRTNIGDYVVSINEEEPGILWVGTNGRGVFYLDFNNRPNNQPEIKIYSTNAGLPPGGALIYKTSKKTLYVFSDGIYFYDQKKNKFIKNELFSREEIIDYSSTTIKEDEENNLWISLGSEVTFYRLRKDGTYKPENTFTSRLSKDIITSIYPEKNGIIWFGGTKLYKLDKNSLQTNNKRYNALIRKVIIGEDSILYGGQSDAEKELIPKIDYANNSMVFEYSAISMVDPSMTEYQSILEGFDEKWSLWKKDIYRNYTNLPSGDYVFKVKGKNLYQLESNTASFTFTILPPWYKTWWAYTIYFLSFGLGIFAVDRLQRRRLTKKERQKARLREIELRADKAEAESKAFQAENERRKNVELLSEMGKEITASLDLDIIFYRLYEYVNQLADATIFGVGIYHPEKEDIEYKLALEDGKRYPTYSRNTKDKNQFPVWCVENRKPVFINDVRTEYKNYIQKYKEPERVLEDGSLSREALSLIYLPLISKERVLGVITIQSFKKGAYTTHHFNILQNLAAYSATAIDNADAYRKLDSALNDLKSTQEKLIIQEKLASLGQLTAGIAHEIKNPLNFVNNFAQLAKELIEEIREEFNKVKDKFTTDFIENFEDLIAGIELNVIKINEHGRRADSIVRSMLQHSRGKAGDRIDSDINSILEEDLNLAYHGLRARDTSFNITIEKYYDPGLEKISIVQQDVSRVFLNIINNGFYEANKKKKTIANNFVPTLKVKTINCPDKIEVRIRDNGNGISPEIRDKLFNPFFTTKPAGEGTGLGLSLSYDIIVKQHGGEIKFETEPGEYTEFIISIPKNRRR